MQSEYKIELAPNAQRQLKKLSKQLQLPIIQKLEDLKKTHEILYLDNEITIELAEKLLDDDIKEVNIVLHKYCHVPLNIHQQVALISFIFNCGDKAFKNSTLLKKLNQSKYAEAADEFLRWVYVKDKKLKGLVERRKIEKAVFLSEIDLLNI